MNVCVRCRKAGYGSWCKTCALVFKWEKDPNSIYSMALQIIGKMSDAMQTKVEETLAAWDISKGSHVAMRNHMKPVYDRMGVLEGLP